MKPIIIENVLILVNLILMLYLVYIVSNRTIETFFHEGDGLDPNSPSFIPHNHIPFFGALAPSSGTGTGSGVGTGSGSGVGTGAGVGSYPFLELRVNGTYPKQTTEGRFIYKSQNLRIQITCQNSSSESAYLTKASDTDHLNTVGLSIGENFCGQVWNLKSVIDTDTDTDTYWHITYTDDSELSGDVQCNNDNQSSNRDGYCLKYNGGTCQGNTASSGQFNGIFCGNFTVENCDIGNPASIHADGRFKIYKRDSNPDSDYAEVKITDITTGPPPIINTNPIVTETNYIIGLEITDDDMTCDGRRPHLSSTTCPDTFVVEPFSQLTPVQQFSELKFKLDEIYADITTTPGTGTTGSGGPTITMEYLRFYVIDNKYTLGYTNDRTQASSIQFIDY